MTTRQKLKDHYALYAFKIANDVYVKKLRHSEGKAILVSNYGFNSNTAGDLINDFRYLMEGESFERTLNAFYANCFLEHIHELYGKPHLQKAVISLTKHIAYYEGHYRKRLLKLREVLQMFYQISNDGNDGGLEQELLQRQIDKNIDGLDQGELLKKIRQLESENIELVEVNGVKYKRNNYIITLIKKLGNYQCQICNHKILKRDGSSYIEAAHIQAKHNHGHETLENIILLCPNHHKEFDLGSTTIDRKNNTLEITLNGTTFTIPPLGGARAF
ncbi:HNH endonuclease [Paraflavitalea sp. CAU 1676]|uniref:HNH endonuclease n=1 Tax=Paraflavitalea sp. CAU 1676 TaxID=3032598 RepID=UPI0023DA0553|nr:HNH endonuclease [Paraflavitalea sp. CAU 1676]MDF2188315.1 HNH endonuclease [Paraflavitalea sp. CAU 1676]